MLQLLPDAEARCTFKGWLTICNGCYKEIEPVGGWQMTDAERKERYDAGNTFAEVLAAERNLKAALMEAFGPDTNTGVQL